MIEKNNHKLLIRLSELCFAVSSFSFLFIPKSNFNGDGSQKVLAYMVGILFWFGLFFGLLFLFILNIKRKQSRFKKYRLIGVFNFFKNKKAKNCDLAMCVSVVSFGISYHIFGLYHTMSLILLTLSTLSVYLHSILNGNNYAYAFRKGELK